MNLNAEKWHFIFDENHEVTATLTAEGERELLSQSFKLSERVAKMETEYMLSQLSHDVLMNLAGQIRREMEKRSNKLK